MNMICPNCGSGLHIIARTDAHFELNEDGSIGRPILDAEGIDCINESIGYDKGDIELKCETCKSSFEAILDEDCEHLSMGAEI